MSDLLSPDTIYTSLIFNHSKSSTHFSVINLNDSHGQISFYKIDTMF